MSGLIQDLGYALRQVRKNPGFTAVALLTLALGIGASTAIFSVVYGVLLRPLPYEKPDRIVRLWEVSATGRRMNFADPNFEDIRSQSHSLQGLAEFGTGTESILAGSQVARLPVASVSQDFFSVMWVQPSLGRGFVPGDHLFGAAPMALVGYGYWKQFLGGAPDLSRIKVTILGQSVSVIGVLPPGFGFPDGTEIWIPRELVERLPSRDAHNWHVIGRLRDGVSLAQAHAELATIARQLKQQYGHDTMMTDVAIVRLQDEMTSPVRRALIVLLGAVGFLLLVACLNVANLLLANAAARRREFAIRIAMGATRPQLVSQFLIEALVLSMSGAAFGILMTRWALAGLVRLAPVNLQRLGDISINVPVLSFALGISLMTAIGLGAINALRAVSAETHGSLSETGFSQRGAQRRLSVDRTIVSGQIAATLVLLTGAGLLGRSLLQVLSVDPGFRTEHVLTMDLALSFADRPEDKVRRVGFLNQLFAGLHAIPGVKDVGGTGQLPLTAPLSDGTYVVLSPGEQPPRSMDDLVRLIHTSPHTGYAAYVPASEGYFRVIGIPLLQGRLFDDRDTMNAPQVAVISESLAREKWPNQDPLGQTIEFGNMDGELRPLAVVGVVGDIRADSLEAAPRPTIYVNYRQRPQATQSFTAVMSTPGETSAVISAAREIVRRLDSNVPPEFGSFIGTVSASLQSRRFSLILVGFFAGAALLLAVVGLYGVMAYAVARRTGEIGVRIALGATPANILALVLKQGVRVIVVGVILGIAGSCALTRAIRSLLFGLSPTDPLTFAAVTLLLVLVALIACYIPARRAAKVDPMVALRYE